MADKKLWGKDLGAVREKRLIPNRYSVPRHRPTGPRGTVPTMEVPWGTENIQAACEYHDLGWSVIPIHPPEPGNPKSGKLPKRRWKEQTKIRLSKGELQTLLDIDDNQAAVCGRLSNIVVVDTDSSEAKRWVRENLPVTPLICKTGSGEHYYYKYPGIEIRPGAKLKGMDLDLRGDDSYVILPPSRHWTGKEYRWVFEPTREMLASLQVFDPSWLAEERKHSVSTVDFDGTPDRKIRRVRAYINKIVAIEGKAGHNQTYRAACKLRDARLSPNEAYQELLRWNATNAKPEWADEEIRHKVKSVFGLEEF